MYPEDLRYTRDHEWIKLDGDVATIGITHHAQSELGDIVFVDLPEAGDTFDQNAEFGTVESVKAVSELYIPVSAEIIEINEALGDTPETVNSDPYEGGWMIKVKLTQPAQAGDLMDAAAYKALVETEAH